jgi:hypothetical protein
VVTYSGWPQRAIESSKMGLHRYLPGRRGRLAMCCRTRPQWRPFVPAALWYHNWPDCPVWPRVRREGGDAVQAVAGAGQVARFGDSVTYCRDDRADHREPYGVRARGRKAHGVACSPARAISSGRGARRTKPPVARSPAGFQIPGAAADWNEPWKCTHPDNLMTPVHGRELIPSQLLLGLPEQPWRSPGSSTPGRHGMRKAEILRMAASFRWAVLSFIMWTEAPDLRLCCYTAMAP